MAGARKRFVLSDWIAGCNPKRQGWRVWSEETNRFLAPAINLSRERLLKDN
jgi:hypothetical protein